MGEEAAEVIVRINHPRLVMFFTTGCPKIWINPNPG